MSIPARNYEPLRPPSIEPWAKTEAAVSGVSWAAVLAGAFVTAAMSLALMTLGAGISLSAISPWPDAGAAVSRIAPMAVIWVILVQILSAAIGGYLAGRLRTKWIDLHTHEVYFRDTAHGFLTWAVSLVLAVVFVASGITRNAGSAARSNQVRLSDYYADKMFRSTHQESSANATAARAEATLILGEALTHQEMQPEDRAYLEQLVVTRTGLSRGEAEKRVADTLAEARYAADTTRKSLAHSFYWLFVALLCGAFSSSYAATIAGRQRDLVPSHVPV